MILKFLSPLRLPLKQIGLLFVRNDKRKLTLLFSLQITLNLLDLIGVLIFGFVSALFISGISNKPLGSRTQSLLKLMHLENNNFQTQIYILAVIASSLLIFKSFFSMVINLKINKFLSFKSASISANLYEKFLQMDVKSIQKQSLSETVYALVSGTQILVSGVLSSIMIIISDLFLFTVLFIGLIYIDLGTALLSVIFFIGAGLIIMQLNTRNVQKVGNELSSHTVEASELVMESILTFREIFTNKKSDYYVTKFSFLRNAIAGNSFRMSYMQNQIKYLMEIFMLFSIILVTILQFRQNSTAHALAAISLYLAIISRLVPAVARIQQSYTQLLGNFGVIKPTLELHKFIRNNTSNNLEGSVEKDSDLIVELKDIDYGFPDSKETFFTKLSLKICRGEFVAIVGKSGSGKSTLIDLLLNLLKPQNGNVILYQKSISDSSLKSNRIGYVPQVTYISKKSLRENIAIGVNPNEINDEKIIEVLKMTDLWNFFNASQNSIYTSLDDWGNNLSVGQRQRIGIARALYNDPDILIMDEATSSLDSQTESEISKNLSTLHGKVTLVVIAHRLSTIKHADRIYYLDNGSVLGVGKFEELKQKLPQFKEQANLLGL